MAPSAPPPLSSSAYTHALDNCMHAFFWQLKDQQTANNYKKWWLWVCWIDFAAFRDEGNERNRILCSQLDKHQNPYHHLKERESEKRVYGLKKVAEDI